MIDAPGACLGIDTAGVFFLMIGWYRDGAVVAYLAHTLAIDGKNTFVSHTILSVASMPHEIGPLHHRQLR